jgi:hypothetical protein
MQLGTYSPSIGIRYGPLNSYTYSITGSIINSIPITITGKTSSNGNMITVSYTINSRSDTASYSLLIQQSSTNISTPVSSILSSVSYTLPYYNMGTFNVSMQVSDPQNNNNYIIPYQPLSITNIPPFTFGTATTTTDNNNNTISIPFTLFSLNPSLNPIYTISLVDNNTYYYIQSSRISSTNISYTFFNVPYNTGTTNNAGGSYYVNLNVSYDSNIFNLNSSNIYPSFKNFIINGDFSDPNNPNGAFPTNWNCSNAQINTVYNTIINNQYIQNLKKYNISYALNVNNAIINNFKNQPFTPSNAVVFGAGYFSQDIYLPTRIYFLELWYVASASNFQTTTLTMSFTSTSGYNKSFTQDITNTTTTWQIYSTSFTISTANTYTFQLSSNGNGTIGLGYIQLY